MGNKLNKCRKLTKTQKQPFGLSTGKLIKKLQKQNG